MPRQTRSRVASSRRGELPSSDPAIAPVPTKITPEPPTRSDSTDIYGVSDREVEYQRNEKQRVQPEQSAVDAAPDQSTTTVAARRITRGRASVTSNTLDTVALQTSKKRRDAAMDKLDSLTSTTSDATDSYVAVGSPVVELGRKDPTAVEASSLLGPRTRGSLSGMEIMDDEIFGNLDSSFDVTGQDHKDSAGHSGVRSADTSTFSVSVFRRQPRRRRSSIVSKDDAPIRPSSRAPTTPGLSSTFSMGNFKRRRRQPSILMSSAQKASLGLQRSHNADDADQDGNEDAVVSGGEEESFLPEAEGTPIRPSQGRRSTARNQEGVEEAEQLLNTEDAVEVEEQRETRSRKRKSTDAHESETAKRQAVEVEDDDDDEIHSSIELDERSSPPSFVERRHQTPELDSDILAPPQSSSSQEGSPTMWPSLRDLGKKAHRQPPARVRKADPTMDDAMSDISEPPSLTHSPNFKATKPTARNKRKESPKLSTADLEALLPRRRRQVQRNDEGDKFGLSDSEQERERPKPRAARKAAEPLHGNSKANHNNQAKNTSVPAKRTTRRTYGSRNFDKENTTEGDSIEVGADAPELLDDTAFEADVTADLSSSDLAEELKAASRKFKEVDKWELDFEEVVEPSSDLPEGR